MALKAVAATVGAAPRRCRGLNRQRIDLRPGPPTPGTTDSTGTT